MSGQCVWSVCVVSVSGPFNITFVQLLIIKISMFVISN